MTVAELIDKLKSCEPTAIVNVISLYDGKYETIGVIIAGKRTVILDVAD